MQRFRRVRGDLTLQTVDEKGMKLSHTFHIDAEREVPIAEAGTFVGAAIQSELDKLKGADKSDAIAKELDAARAEIARLKEAAKAKAAPKPRQKPEPKRRAPPVVKE